MEFKSSRAEPRPCIAAALTDLRERRRILSVRGHTRRFVDLAASSLSRNEAQPGPCASFPHLRLRAGPKAPATVRARFKRRKWILALGLAGLFAGVAPAPTKPQTGALEAQEVEALIDSGQLDKAWSAVGDRIAVEGETARLLLLQGLVRYRQDQFEEALALLNRSFVRDERDPDTSKVLGLCLVKLGRGDLAATFFEIAAKLAPDDASAHYYLGLNAYTRRRFAPAVRAFERAVDIRPQSSENRSFLGRSYEAVGRVEDARRQYLEAIALNRAGADRSADPPLLLGTLLYRQGRLAAADRYLREALEYDPDSALARYWLGLLLESRGEWDSAIRELRHASRLGPEDHRPHYALARLYRRIGDQGLAAEAVQRFRARRVRNESESFRTE